MKSVGDQLLKSLAGGVRPFDVLPVQIRRGEIDFDAMLDGARSGTPETNLGVRFGPSVSGMFDQQDQLAIARSVDLAAIAGVDHALILHDQRTLRVDVRNRVVLDADEITEQRVTDGIDGFIAAKLPTRSAKSSEKGPNEGALVSPARIVRNASLVYALAGRVPGV